jgi:hypothetical protein
MPTNEDSNHQSDEDVEELLDKLWENWSSRRRCEQTHQPKYLQKGNSERQE